MKPLYKMVISTALWNLIPACATPCMECRFVRSWSFWYIFASRSERIPCWKIKPRLIDDLGKLKRSSRVQKEVHAIKRFWESCDAFRSAGNKCSCNCTEFVWFQVIAESISNFSELASLFIVSMNLYFCEWASRFWRASHYHHVIPFWWRNEWVIF